jgi:glycosyltransferase involved in cell wall biosynthesis
MTSTNALDLPRPPSAAPFIEIALPTYNRLPYLEECLNSLSASFAAVPEHLRRPVKVSIWDGGSKDSTPDWVRANGDHFGFPVELIETPAPIPFGERVASFLARSTADFIWYFSDDDVVVPECFATLFSVLESNPGIGAAAINYSEWTSDMASCLRPQMISLTNQAVSADVDNIALLGQSAGFLPVVVLSRAYGQLVPMDQKLAKTVLPFVPPYLVTAVNHGLIIIEKPLIKQRSNNSAFGKANPTDSWYPIFVQEWGMVCDECARLGLSKRFVRLLRASTLRGRNLTFRRIVGERLNDFYQPPNLFGLCASEYGTYPRFWLAVAPAFLVPIGLLRAIRWLYRKLRRSPSTLRR